MTKRLYERDIYMRSCEATIIAVTEDDKGIWVELDQSIFYPEGGGQPSDLGTIGDVNVLDVKEKDGKLLHKVNAKPEAGPVICKLDWERRLDNMQQHCGEHILSGIMMRDHQSVNKGFHMGEEYVTIDMDIKEMTPQMLKTLEDEANKAIYANVPINIHVVHNKEEAESFPLRKHITVDEDIRIVQIQGVDCVACCGSHPATTGDVGVIKILKAEKYKGMTRIYFKCGMRALRDFQAKHNIVTELCQKYSADESTLMERLETEERKNQEMKDQLNSLRRKINEAESRRLLEEADGTLIYSVSEDMGADDLSGVSKRIVDLGGHVVLLGSTQDGKVILAHNGDMDLHCGKLFKDSIKDYNGRGGGGDKMAQGAFQSAEDLRGFMEHLKGLIEA